MTKLLHHSPLGPLQIAGVRGSIAPGEPFEVTPDQAASLLKQSDVFAPVDGNAEGYAALTVVELRDELKRRELPTSGRRPELLARIRDDDDAAAAALPVEPQVVETEPLTTQPTDTDSQGEQA